VTTKDHWYDGIFYDRCIAPGQDPLYTSVIGLIDPGSTVLDVGCGTGRLAWHLAGRCPLIQGIDPSRRNIARAAKIWDNRGKPRNIRFCLGTLADHLPCIQEPYDYAVISYVLHELDEAERLPMLQSLAGVARRIVLADFRVPRRRGIMDATTVVVEFLAGRDHYRGFQTFTRSGGLLPLVKEAGLSILEESTSAPSTAHVLLASSDKNQAAHNSHPNPEVKT
jgi:ubiquinone/menaquinone biosynthesis C-methylase UbiE